MERRDFVKIGLTATSGTILLSNLPSCLNSENQLKDLNSFYKGFQEPPSDSRVFVRWWWNGNRLTGNEILREHRWTGRQPYTSMGLLGPVRLGV